MFRRHSQIVFATVVVVFSGISGNPGFTDEESAPIIVHPDGALFKEQLAAREIQRYLYVRTGHLLSIREYAPSVLEGTDAVIVTRSRGQDVEQIEAHGPLGCIISLDDHIADLPVAEPRRCVIRLQPFVSP